MDMAETAGYGFVDRDRGRVFSREQSVEDGRFVWAALFSNEQNKGV